MFRVIADREFQKKNGSQTEKCRFSGGKLEKSLIKGEIKEKWNEHLLF